MYICKQLVEVAAGQLATLRQTILADTVYLHGCRSVHSKSTEITFLVHLQVLQQARTRRAAALLSPCSSGHSWIAALSPAPEAGPKVAAPASQVAAALTSAEPGGMGVQLVPGALSAATRAAALLKGGGKAAQPQVQPRNAAGEADTEGRGIRVDAGTATAAAAAVHAVLGHAQEQQAAEVNFSNGCQFEEVPVGGAFLEGASSPRFAHNMYGSTQWAPGGLSFAVSGILSGNGTPLRHTPRYGVDTYEAASPSHEDGSPHSSSSHSSRSSCSDRRSWKEDNRGGCRESAGSEKAVEGAVGTVSQVEPYPVVKILAKGWKPDNELTHNDHLLASSAVEGIHIRGEAWRLGGLEGLGLQDLERDCAYGAVSSAVGESQGSCGLEADDSSSAILAAAGSAAQGARADSKQHNASLQSRVSVQELLHQAQWGRPPRSSSRSNSGASSKSLSRSRGKKNNGSSSSSGSGSCSSIAQQLEQRHVLKAESELFLVPSHLDIQAPSVQEGEHFYLLASGGHSGLPAPTRGLTAAADDDVGHSSAEAGGTIRSLQALPQEAEALGARPAAVGSKAGSGVSFWQSKIKGLLARADAAVAGVAISKTSQQGGIDDGLFHGRLAVARASAAPWDAGANAAAAAADMAMGGDVGKGKHIMRRHGAANGFLAGPASRPTSVSPRRTRAAVATPAAAGAAAVAALRPGSVSPRRARTIAAVPPAAALRRHSISPGREGSSGAAAAAPPAGGLRQASISPSSKRRIAAAAAAMTYRPGPVLASRSKDPAAQAAAAVTCVPSVSPSRGRMRVVAAAAASAASRSPGEWHVRAAVAVAAARPASTSPSRGRRTSAATTATGAVELFSGVHAAANRLHAPRAASKAEGGELLPQVGDPAASSKLHRQVPATEATIRSSTTAPKPAVKPADRAQARIEEAAAGQSAAVAVRARPAPATDVVAAIAAAAPSVAPTIIDRAVGAGAGRPGVLKFPSGASAGNSRSTHAAVSALSNRNETGVAGDKAAAGKRRFISPLVPSTQRGEAQQQVAAQLQPQQLVEKKVSQQPEAMQKSAHGFRGVAAVGGTKAELQGVPGFQQQAAAGVERAGDHVKRGGRGLGQVGCSDAQQQQQQQLLQDVKLRSQRQQQAQQQLQQPLDELQQQQQVPLVKPEGGNRGARKPPPAVVAGANSCRAALSPQIVTPKELKGMFDSLEKPKGYAVAQRRAVQGEVTHKHCASADSKYSGVNGSSVVGEDGTGRNNGDGAGSASGSSAGIHGGLIAEARAAAAGAGGGAGAGGKQLGVTVVEATAAGSGQERTASRRSSSNLRGLVASRGPTPPRRVGGTAAVSCTLAANRAASAATAAGQGGAGASGSLISPRVQLGGEVRVAASGRLQGRVAARTRSVTPPKVLEAGRDRTPTERLRAEAASRPGLGQQGRPGQESGAQGGVGAGVVTSQLAGAGTEGAIAGGLGGRNGVAAVRAGRGRGGRAPPGGRATAAVSVVGARGRESQLRSAMNSRDITVNGHQVVTFLPASDPVQQAVALRCSSSDASTNGIGSSSSRRSSSSSSNDVGTIGSCSNIAVVNAAGTVHPHELTMDANGVFVADHNHLRAKQPIRLKKSLAAPTPSSALMVVGASSAWPSNSQQGKPAHAGTAAAGAMAMAAGAARRSNDSGLGSPGRPALTAAAALKPAAHGLPQRGNDCSPRRGLRPDSSTSPPARNTFPLQHSALYADAGGIRTSVNGSHDVHVGAASMDSGKAISHDGHREHHQHHQQQPHQIVVSQGGVCAPPVSRCISPFGEDGRSPAGMAAAAAVVAAASGSSSAALPEWQWRDLWQWLGTLRVQLLQEEAVAPLLSNPLRNGLLYCDLAAVLTGVPVSGALAKPKDLSAARGNIVRALMHLGLIGQMCGMGALKAARAESMARAAAAASASSQLSSPMSSPRSSPRSSRLNGTGSSFSRPGSSRPGMAGGNVWGGQNAGCRDERWSDQGIGYPNSPRQWGTSPRAGRQHQWSQGDGGNGPHEDLGITLGPELSTAILGAANGGGGGGGVLRSFCSSAATLRESSSCYSRVQGSAVEQQLLGVVEGALKGEGSCVWGLLSGLRTHFPHAGSAARAQQQERRRQHEEVLERRKGGWKEQEQQRQQQEEQQDVLPGIANGEERGVALHTAETRPSMVTIRGLGAKAISRAVGDPAATAAITAAAAAKGARGRGSHALQTDKHRLRSKTPPSGRLKEHQHARDKEPAKDQRVASNSRQRLGHKQQQQGEEIAALAGNQLAAQQQRQQQRWQMQQPQLQMQNKQQLLGAGVSLGMRQDCSPEPGGRDRGYGPAAGRRGGPGQGSRSRALVLDEAEEEQLAG